MWMRNKDKTIILQVTVMEKDVKQAPKIFCKQVCDKKKDSTDADKQKYDHYLSEDKLLVGW